SMYRRCTRESDPDGMNRTARTVLYTLSGGALSALFTLAGASQAEAAPPPPKPSPSPAHGVEEKTRARQQKAAANKSKAAPQPAVGLRAAEVKHNVTRDQSKANTKPATGLRATEVRHNITRDQTKKKPKPKPDTGLRAAEVKHNITRDQSKANTKPATGLRATEVRHNIDRDQTKAKSKPKPGQTDGVLERTAAGRSAYAASQQGGAPGTGLRRQAGQARDEADRLAGVRDRSRTTSLFEQEQNRRLAIEADAKADRLESKVFSDHFHAQVAASARQNNAWLSPSLDPPPPNRPVVKTPQPPASRRGGALPQSVRLAEAAAEQQAEAERRFAAQRQANNVLKPGRTDGVLERTAAGRSAYAASQQGGAPGSGLRRQSDQAREEADRLAVVHHRSRIASLPEQEQNRRLAAEADAKADRLEGREILQRNRQKRAEDKRAQQAHQDRLRREAESRYKPPQSVGLCLNGAVGFGVAGKAGGCVVLDSRGVGFSVQETLSAEAGLGVSGSATVQVSSADIEGLAGYSVVAGGSGVVGVGAEGSVGVSTDGSYNWTVSGGPAVGVDASVGIGVQDTGAARVADYSDLLPLLSGPIFVR
ncbi:MAG: hypothetical protein ABW215_15480, partial [Kibdelosporangium sp.]